MKLLKIDIRLVILVLIIILNINSLIIFTFITYSTSEGFLQKFTGKAMSSNVSICIDWDLNFIALASQTAYVGVPYSIDINITNEALYFPYLNFTDNTSLFEINRTTGVINFTLNSSYLGRHSAELYVGNNACNEPDDNMTFIFNLSYQNHAPVLNMSNQTNLTEDVYFYLNVSEYASDPEGDTLKFYDDYPRFVIGEDTGIISFTPGDDDVGNFTVRIYVVDPGLLLDYQDVFFSVRNVNDIPNLSHIGAQTAYINVSFNLTLRAYDPDPEEVLAFDSNYSWFLNSSGPLPTVSRWSSYDISLLFTNYTEWFNTTHSINITVNDTNGSIDSEVISFTVLLENHAPNITSYAPLNKQPSIYLPACQYFNITKEDIDGTIPSVEWYVNDVFTGYTSDDFTYCAVAAGLYNITVIISDGLLNDSESWLLNVMGQPVVEGGGPKGPSGGGARQICINLWVCTDWSKCEISNTQARKCTDSHKCGTLTGKPLELQDCTYSEYPSCFNGIKDQDEVLPDCGGKTCPACPTCDDGIQNQKETSIDCGGPCPVCKEVLAPVNIEKMPFEIMSLFMRLVDYWLFWLILTVLLLSVIRLRKELKEKVVGRVSSKISNALKVRQVNRLLSKAYKLMDEKNYKEAEAVYNRAKVMYAKLPKALKAKIKIRE